MNQFEDRNRSSGDQGLPPIRASEVAKAAGNLPASLTDRLSELQEQYLAYQSLRARPEASSRLNSIIKLSSGEYLLKSVLGSGDEATTYIAQAGEAQFLLKIFNNPANVALHISETEKSRNQLLPVIRILDSDQSKGVLLLESKLGVPISYLLQTDVSGLSEAEELAVLELYLAFKRHHSLEGLIPGNLALHPEFRGVFIIDHF